MILLLPRGRACIYSPVGSTKALGSNWLKRTLKITPQRWWIGNPWGWSWLATAARRPCNGVGWVPIPYGRLSSHSFWCLLEPSRLQKSVFSYEIHIPSSETLNRANDIWILIILTSPSQWCSPIHQLRYFYSMISLPLALFLCDFYKT